VIARHRVGLVERFAREFARLATSANDYINAGDIAKHADQIALRLPIAGRRLHQAFEDGARLGIAGEGSHGIAQISFAWSALDLRESLIGIGQLLL